MAASSTNGFGNVVLPTLLPHVLCAIAIAAGARHSMAFLNDGTLRTWGDNGAGRLGRRIETVDLTDPVEVGPGFNVGS